MMSTIYAYLGDKFTRGELKNAICFPVIRADGKCIRGRNSNMLVKFESGEIVNVLARLLRKQKHITMKITEGDKVYDIGMGEMGGGTTIWNRNETVNGDYKKLAVVSHTAVINLYDDNLPSSVLKVIKAEQMSIMVKIAVHNFEEGGKAFFNMKSPDQETAFYRFTEYLKTNKVPFGETNETPQMCVVYDSRKWDINLRRITHVKSKLKL